MRNVINGILGGIVVVAFLVIYLCFSESFNYKSIYILNTCKICVDSITTKNSKAANVNYDNKTVTRTSVKNISIDSLSSTKEDSTKINKDSANTVEASVVKKHTDDFENDEIRAIRELKKDGLLLTPNEYTSNIGSYYNTLIAFLSILFVLFSLVGYISIKIASKKDIVVSVEAALKDMLNDSVKFRETILGSLYGKVEDNFVDKEDFSDTTSALEAQIEEIRKEIIAKNPQVEQEIE